MSSLTSFTQAYFLDSNSDSKKKFKQINLRENSFLTFIGKYFPNFLRHVIEKKNITIFIFLHEEKIVILDNFYPFNLVKTFYNYHNLTFKNNNLNNHNFLISDLLFSDGIIHILV